MTTEQLKIAMKQDIETHFKMMDDIIATLQKLQHDSRLTEQEQKDISIAWGYLYYLNVVDKKMSKLKEGENYFPH